MKKIVLASAFLIFLVAAAYVASDWLGWQVETGPPAEGSVILISLDTLRADMLNTYGYDEYPTSPFLDSFAAENVLFENSFVQEPRTLTSHMSMLTGLFPQHHKVDDEAVLDDEIPTIPSLLRELGYKTQAFVDGGFVDSHWGFDRGFDGYEDEDRRGLKGTIPRAIRWLRSNAHQRFFLFLHSYDVHSTGAMPYYPAPEPFEGIFSGTIDSDLKSDDMKEFARKWESRKENLSDDDRSYIKATYADGIRHVDAQLELFFDYLKRSGIYDSALIIVWSDHGEGLYDHDAWTHGELYDHTIRVPLLMRIPGYGRAGQRVRSVVSSIDLAPTILEFVNYPTTVSMDGESVLGFLSKDEGNGVAYSIRSRLGAKLFSIRTRRYHLIWDGNTNQSEFFDLEVDPEERANLFPSGLAAESALQDQLFSWIETYERARAEGPREENTLIDPVMRRRLRALGYVR